MKSAVKPMMMILTLTMFGFLGKIIFSPMGEVNQLKDAQKKINLIRNSERTMIENLTVQEKPLSKTVANTGSSALDIVYTISLPLLKEVENLSESDRTYILAATHYLIFERMMIATYTDFCKSFDKDISNYYQIYFDKNKAVRNMIKAYLEALGKMDILEKSFKTALNDERLKQVLISETSAYFENFMEKTGKDYDEICSTLPIGNMMYGADFLNHLDYHYNYEKNHNILMRKK